jgi:hypothetical protein
MSPFPPQALAPHVFAQPAIDTSWPTAANWPEGLAEAAIGGAGSLIASLCEKGGRWLTVLITHGIRTLSLPSEEGVGRGCAGRR